MTGQKLWAVGEEVLAPDFNSYVQTQVVAQFANVAARDAWAGAPDGALCITTDSHTVWQRKGGAWVQAIFANAQGASFFPTAAGFTPGGAGVQVPGLSNLQIISRPYMRVVTVTCQLALSASTGGTPTYFVGTIQPAGGVMAGFGGNRSFLFPRANPGTGQGTCIFGLNANTNCNVTVVCAADVANTVSCIAGNSWLDISAIPVQGIAPLSP